MISLRTKIYVAGVTSILVVIGGLSLEFGRRYRQQLVRSLETEVSKTVEATAAGLKSELELWKNLLSLAAKNSGDAAAGFRSLASTNSDVFAAVYLDASGRVTETFTDRVNDHRLGKRRFIQLRKAVRAAALAQIKEQVKDRQQVVQIRPFSQDPASGLMIVSGNFTRGGRQFGAALVVWTGELISMLPAAPSLFGQIVNNRLELMFSAGGTKKKWSRHRQVMSTTIGSNTQTLLQRYRLGAANFITVAKAIDDAHVVTFVRNIDADLSEIGVLMRRLGYLTAIYLLVFVMAAFLASRGTITRIVSITKATRQIAGGNFSIEIPHGGNDELGVLTSAVISMSKQIRTLIDVRVAAVKREQELETASIVQSHFFPRGHTSAPFCQIFGTFWPATECGGDIWGEFRDQSGNQYVLIADATGHGVPAALVTAMAYAAIVSVNKFIAHKSGEWRPSEVLSFINSVLWSAGAGQTTMTCVVAKLNPLTGSVEYANAGHNWPILLTAKVDGLRRVGRKTLTSAGICSLMCSGNPLGMHADLIVKDHVERLLPSDKLFFYTDGLIECRNKDGRVWQTRRLREALESLIDRDAETLCKSIVNMSREFLQGTERSDDITVMTVGINEQWPVAPRSKGWSAS